MSNSFTTETREVQINDKSMYISILTYLPDILADLNTVGAQVNSIYQHLAQEFLVQPAIAAQRSACVVSDTTPIVPMLTPQLLNQWYARGSEEAIQTQQYLFSLFKRPAFQIMIAPGFNGDVINTQLQRLNSGATPMVFVNTMDDALREATHLLSITHR